MTSFFGAWMVSFGPIWRGIGACDDVILGLRVFFVDNRSWMTSFGPIWRGIGSCDDVILGLRVFFVDNRSWMTSFGPIWRGIGACDDVILGLRVFFVDHFHALARVGSCLARVWRVGGVLAFLSPLYDYWRPEPKNVSFLLSRHNVRRVHEKLSSRRSEQADGC